MADGPETRDTNISEAAILKLMSEVKQFGARNSRLPLTYNVDDKTSLIITEGSGTFGGAKTELRSLAFWVVEKK